MLISILIGVVLLLAVVGYLILSVIDLRDRYLLLFGDLERNRAIAVDRCDRNEGRMDRLFEHLGLRDVAVVRHTKIVSIDKECVKSDTTPMYHKPELFGVPMEEPITKKKKRKK